jgi:hypothetical protein
VRNSRTGWGSRSHGTATKWLFCPQSMPAASGWMRSNRGVERRSFFRARGGFEWCFIAASSIVRLAQGAADRGGKAIDNLLDGITLRACHQ